MLGNSFIIFDFFPLEKYVKKLLSRKNIDGIDQWKSLLKNTSSPRIEMLYNIDPGCPYDNQKFENDTSTSASTTFKNAGIRFHEMKLLLGNPGKIDGWIPPPEVVDLAEPEKEFNSIVNHYFSSSQDMFNCKVEPQEGEEKFKIRLFNLTADPFEKHNLASELPEIVSDLMEKLEKYFNSMIPPDNAAEIIDGNPNRHGGFLGPSWCKAEPL